MTELLKAFPTIGHYRSHGQTTFLIYCNGTHCSKSGRKTFDEIGLPDDTPLVDISKRKSFRCTRCGSIDVMARPDWPISPHGAGIGPGAWGMTNPQARKSDA